MATEAVSLAGTLKGHNGWVTCIATNAGSPDLLLTGSRDRHLVSWNLNRNSDPYGQPKKVLTGHSHFVQDIVISYDGQFALSGSWDGTLRLWDLNNGSTTRTFIGHTKDVLSVAFSGDNRQIVSGSRDKTIKLWNTLGECKYTMEGHTDWVSCVRFSPNLNNPTVVSGSWDKTVKVWNLTNCTLSKSLEGHTGYVNSVTISPDGSLCASGGRDGTVRLWDLNEGKHLYSLEAGNVVHTLCFSPTRYWLCAGTDSGLKIWDLVSKQPVAELTKEVEHFGVTQAVPNPAVVSLAWAPDGNSLYAGYTDNNIRVWQVSRI